MDSGTVPPTHLDNDGSLFVGSSLKSVTAVTMNCMGSFTKRLHEFSPSARSTLRDAHIVCLQECRVRATILPGDYDRLADLLRWPLKPDFPAIISKDTGIIVRIPGASAIHHEVGDKYSYLRISLPALANHRAPSLSIFSIHGPFTEQGWRPIHAALRLLHPDPSVPCIIGADWNSIPDPILDSFNARITAIPWETPAAAIAHIDTVDTFRHLYPTTPAFTHFQIHKTGPLGTPTLRSAKRLDSIRCSAFLAPFISTSQALHTSSDHRAVSVTLGTNPPPPPPPTLSHNHELTWALHPGLWLSPAFVRDVRRLADQYWPTHSISAPTSLEEWILYAAAIRNGVRILSRIHGAQQRELIDSVGASAIALDRLDWSDPSAVHALPSLLYTYRSALAALEISISLPFHSRLAASEMRHSSWLSMQSGPSKRSPLPSLSWRGKILTTGSEKLEAIWEFYSALYTPPPLPPLFELDCAFLLSHLRLRLPSNPPACLTAPYSADEIAQSIKLANRRSSPGPDGLPYRLWYETSEDSAPPLSCLTNQLAEGAALDVVARSILLPKKGDLSDLSNYRPISISDSYVRVIARVIAARLQLVGDRIMPWEQAAFLPGRRTSMIAGLLQGLADLSATPSMMSPPAFVVVSLDQQKAYDRVRQEWLFLCLQALGLPDHMINVLRSLYHGPATRFYTAEGVSRLVRFNCGVLQGDPSSCVVYNITLQPLLDYLAALRIGIDVPSLGRLTFLAFADDVLLFFEASARGLSDWNLTTKAFGLYEGVSNAKINTKKSSYWLIGTPASHHEPATRDLIQAIETFGLSAADTTSPHPHLGHPLTVSPGPALATLVQRCAAIRTRALCFPTTGVSLLARVRRAKQFLTSRLWHSIAIGPLPREFSTLYFEAINPYLFGGTRPFVSRDHLTKPISQGGFGLIHPDHMATALSLSFLRRYLDDDTPFGVWLRNGLTNELLTVHKIPPAALLLTNTKLLHSLQDLDVRASGFFGRLLHALSQVPLNLAPEWETLDWRALITLPWTHAAPGFPLQDQQYTRYHSGGWITWGDILWMNTRTDSTVASPYPVGPPPNSRAVQLRGPFIPHLGRRHGAAPSLDWPSMWQKLPPSVRRTLLTLHFDTVAAHEATTASSLHSEDPWIPVPQDFRYSDFPWHLLSIGRFQLAALTTSQIRNVLRSPTPYIPLWKLPTEVSPGPFFKSVWSMLHRCPLDEDALSTTLLALGRNIWTYRLDELCPNGCNTPDSPTHGLCECPQVLRVWSACVPLARALGIQKPLPLDAVSIVSAWPNTGQHRIRLATWRAIVLVIICRLRTTAGAESRKTNRPPNFRHCDRADPLSLAAVALYSSLTARWAALLRRSKDVARAQFISTWTTDCPFLYLDGSILRARTIQLPSGTDVDVSQLTAVSPDAQ